MTQPKCIECDGTGFFQTGGDTIIQCEKCHGDGVDRTFVLEINPWINGEVQRAIYVRPGETFTFRINMEHEIEISSKLCGGKARNYD